MNKPITRDGEVFIVHHTGRTKVVVREFWHPRRIIYSFTVPPVTNPNQEEKLLERVRLWASSENIRIRINGRWE